MEGVGTDKGSEEEEKERRDKVWKREGDDQSACSFFPPHPLSITHALSNTQTLLKSFCERQKENVHSGRSCQKIKEK